MTEVGRSPNRHLFRLAWEPESDKTPLDNAQWKDLKDDYDSTTDRELAPTYLVLDFFFLVATAIYPLQTA